MGRLMIDGQNASGSFNNAESISYGNSNVKVALDNIKKIQPYTLDGCTRYSCFVKDGICYFSLVVAMNATTKTVTGFPTPYVSLLDFACSIGNANATITSILRKESNTMTLTSSQASGSMTVSGSYIIAE